MKGSSLSLISLSVFCISLLFQSYMLLLLLSPHLLTQHFSFLPDPVFPLVLHLSSSHLFSPTPRFCSTLLTPLCPISSLFPHWSREIHDHRDHFPVVSFTAPCSSQSSHDTAEPYSSLFFWIKKKKKLKIRGLHLNCPGYLRKTGKLEGVID